MNFKKERCTLMKRKILLKLIMTILVIYALFTFINQQKTLNAYKTEQSYITSKITDAEQYNEDLNSKKDNINSPEYIEEMARTKLDMYLPNERVYIDVGK